MSDRIFPCHNGRYTIVWIQIMSISRLQPQDEDYDNDACISAD
jgi:hypothetical protein